MNLKHVGSHFHCGLAILQLTFVKNEQPPSDIQATAPLMEASGLQPSPASNSMYGSAPQCPFSQSYLAFKRLEIKGMLQSTIKQLPHVISHT